MPNYHLLESADLAKMGMVSDDKLTKALGEDLADYVEELDIAKEEMRDARARAREAERRVIELEALSVYHLEIIAKLEKA